MNEMQLLDSSEVRLESIAKDIELLQATAVLRVAERLAEAREIFRYRRDEGGFTGWIEGRLKFSRSTAYNLLAIHERLGNETVQLLDTFPDKILYLLAAKSTPVEIRNEVLDLAANGEHLSHTQVKDMIAQAKREAADEYEQRIATLTRRYEEQEARLRADLESSSLPNLEEVIEEALAPLHEKIRRLEEERRKQHEAKPKREDPYSRQSAGIINGLHYLVTELTIDAGKFIEHQKIVADATGQTFDQVMAEAVRNARNVQAWMSALIELTEVKS